METSWEYHGNISDAAAGLLRIFGSGKAFELAGSNGEAPAGLSDSINFGDQNSGKRVRPYKN